MPHELSRRSFLRGTAASSAGLTMMGASPLASAAPASPSAALSVRGPAPGPLTLMVNGVARTVLAAPGATLAEVLRGPLDLTGTKIACDRGACSACTVWLDDAPVCACMMLAVEVGTRKVTTIEGLARNGVLHPVQVAFIEHDALQCGFCTPGMVMSCAALVQANAHPTGDDVRTAISGHLCRCGTYPHVVQATLAAAGAIRKE